MKTKGKYVDGFLFTVPTKNLEAYRKMARLGAKAWRKFGALEYKECMIDDAKPAHINFTFEKATRAKKGETIWFSYIVFKSKAHRDAVNKKVMAYMEKEYAGHENDPMPFDMKRMAYAGFKVNVSD